MVAGLLLALGTPARAERAPTAVLWTDRGDDAVTAAIDRSLQGDKALKPLDEARVKQLLVDGGPAARLDEKVAAGRERFAQLVALPEADALLAEAEAIALRELPVADACPRLVAIETLRLRYAELSLDEGAAGRAAAILAPCAQNPSPEVKQAIARHPLPRPATPTAGVPTVRIDSEPPGATVYLDLRPVGKTPLDLRAAGLAWRGDALLDVELDGYAKVHRVVPGGGALAVSLARADRLPTLVDHAHGAGDPPEEVVAAIGREVGAARVLVLRHDPTGILARVLSVSSGRWIKSALTLELKAGGGEALAARAVEYAAASNAIAPAGVAGAGPIDTRADDKKGGAAHHGPQPTAAPKPAASSVPAWKKWYTWVAAGAVAALVGGLVLAEHLGDDQVTVHVTH